MPLFKIPPYIKVPSSSRRIPDSQQMRIEQSAINLILYGQIVLKMNHGIFLCAIGKVRRFLKMGDFLFNDKKGIIKGKSWRLS